MFSCNIGKNNCRLLHWQQGHMGVVSTHYYHYHYCSGLQALGLITVPGTTWWADHIPVWWSSQFLESAPPFSRVCVVWPCTSHTGSSSKTWGHLSGFRLWCGPDSEPNWNETYSIMQDWQSSSDLYQGSFLSTWLASLHKKYWTTFCETWWKVENEPKKNLL